MLNTELSGDQCERGIEIGNGSLVHHRGYLECDVFTSLLQYPLGDFEQNDRRHEDIIDVFDDTGELARVWTSREVFQPR